MVAQNGTSTYLAVRRSIGKCGLVLVRCNMLEKTVCTTDQWWSSSVYYGVRLCGTDDSVLQEQWCVAQKRTGVALCNNEYHGAVLQSSFVILVVAQQEYVRTLFCGTLGCGKVCRNTLS